MSENLINENTVIRRSEALLSNNLGDDVVMMDIEQGSYYGLEAVAARIWHLAENPVSIGAICQNLTSEYAISRERCVAEVRDFIEELLAKKIVHIVD